MRFARDVMLIKSNASLLPQLNQQKKMLSRHEDAQLKSLSLSEYLAHVTNHHLHFTEQTSDL